MKLHQYSMREMKLLDSRRLSEKDRKQLLDLYEEIKDMAFPSILSQFETEFIYRKKLDLVILQIMGFSTSRIVELLDYLYPVLADEIQNLKELMAG